ncbi:hypothetical protein PR202_ga09765 [Eleusine coracana subsp. coracana]|uniref:Glycosyltransferase n=1 Tax=Eleusine coracana subsp. coracana TaxID=191504 RepID=A0AAV5C4I5_ELECO|nr:hypothetical protein QOZ80_1AG0032230 [Eleusine coracana subsp. coracana]GJM93221.1 hypothetical protein PR202_ga09765 [Eleusine coracana subsp. coracana]
MKKSVVLYPGLGVGHLTPMVQLAQVFLQHDVDVTVALVEPPVKSPDFAKVVSRAAASNPSITFHVLPPPSSTPDGSNPDGTPKQHVVQMFHFLGAMNAPLRDFLRSLLSVDALVIDMFCCNALDVAAELGLPVYFFYASGAGDLSVFLQMPSVHARMTTSYSELGDSVLSLPGAPPFKVSDLPADVTKDSEAGNLIWRIFERMPESNGILVNTFESLETRAVRALSDGLCVPDRVTPPVYCIGPLVSAGGGEKEHECLQWLDTQPDNSVVFLSFGSMGTFPKKQLEQIAIGLEKSGQRFLWVVRTPPGDDHKHGEPLPEPDLDVLLPDGFLERTKERGLVLKSWAPQVDVLNHRATGAFVTHCGWNSTLEGVTAGLPLLCWPMYAEQKMNKIFIVEEMKLGVELKGYDKEIVEAEEVETKVRYMMDSEGGRALRERAESAKNRATEALKKGGSSHVAFVEFLNKV